MPYKKRRYRVRPVPILILLLLLAGLVGGILFWSHRQREADAAFTAMVAARIDAGASAIHAQEAERSQLLSLQYTRLREEREAEEARLAAEAAAEAERIRLEQIRIEEERKRQEAARLAAEEEARRQAAEEEQRRKEEEERQKAAEEAARLEATIAAEQAKAEAEKAERARLSEEIKAQEAVAIAEHEAYLARGVLPTVQLRVPTIYQNPELPNGCEVTSLAILINYIDSYVDKTLLADEFLPKFPFYMLEDEKTRAGGDPELFYAGDPRLYLNAYYCFAGPLVACANDYFESIGVNRAVLDLTGATESELISQLDMGYPVVVWGTLSMGDAYTFAGSTWVLDEETGAKHTPFINLHCVVLTGYDDEYFLFSDPIRGQVAYRRSTFMNAYRQIGSRAMTIH